MNTARGGNKVSYSPPLSLTFPLHLTFGSGVKANSSYWLAAMLPLYYK